MRQKWWMPLYGILFGIYVPRELREEEGEMILHLSDTPSTVYGALGRLVRTLSPRWIIHTGDLADDVKLELTPRELPRYRGKLRELKKALSDNGGRNLVLVTGNHDHQPTVRETFPESLIFSDRGRVELCGEVFNLSHDRDGLGRPLQKYNLFGHAPAGERGQVEGSIFLNGLSAIHVIIPALDKTFSLPYPGYVDDGRLVRRRRGL